VSGREMIHQVFVFLKGGMASGELDCPTYCSI